LVTIIRVIECPFNLLKPKTYVTSRQFNIQQFYVVPRIYLCVLYGSQNKQRLFLFAALTYSFLKPRQRVFTARYGLGL